MVNRLVVSVVIPTRNRLALLLRCVHSVRLAANVPYEIVVADGESTDRTAEWARSQSDVVLVSEPATGAVRAVNAGCRKARGEWCLILNDDCELHGGKLSALVAEAEAGKLAQIGLPWSDPGEPLHFAATPQCGWNGVRCDYANFGMTRKAAGDAVGWWGPFDHHAGDSFLTIELMRAGYQCGPAACGLAVKHLRTADSTRHTENTDMTPFLRYFALREVPIE